jgi:DNA-binding transcriptional MerR regulator
MKHSVERSQFLTVGDLAKRFQVSSEAVRRWDGLGLLCPAMRLPNGTRLYRSEDVEHFAGFRAQRQAAERAAGAGR